jgi:hypothetical protein
MTFEEAVDHALSLGSVERGSHYGAPAAKANGHAIVAPGRETGSFCLMIDRDTVGMLKETDPATFWQTPHYEGWPSILVRSDTQDPARVRAMIERARDQALAKKPPRPRQK